MNYFLYPDRIADDDEDFEDEATCMSAEIEGGVANTQGRSKDVNPAGNPMPTASDEPSSRDGVAAQKEQNSPNFEAEPSLNSNGRPNLSRAVSSRVVVKSHPWKSVNRSSSLPGNPHEHPDHGSFQGLFENENAETDDDESLEVSLHGDKRNFTSAGGGNQSGASDKVEDKNDNPDNETREHEEKSQMAALIQHERERRLGNRNSVSKSNEIENSMPNEKSSSTTINAATSAPPPGGLGGGVFGGIFTGLGSALFGGGGGGGANDATVNSSAERPTNTLLKSSSATEASEIPPLLNFRHRQVSAPSMTNNSFVPAGYGGSMAAYSQHGPGREVTKPQLDDKKDDKSQTVHGINSNEDGKDNDSSSCSSEESSSEDENDSTSQSGEWSSNSSSNNKHSEGTLSPRQRVRARALRYLSNSCVDAGRRAKTASYVRGLERLDLRRKRDRYERELEVVEKEMKKDRWDAGDFRRRKDSLGGENDGKGERDVVMEMAAKLVREMPLLTGLPGKSATIHFRENYMTYDEYCDILNGYEANESDKNPNSLWEDRISVDSYIHSLQSRLKGTLERTRSLEKRMAVLEQTGDEVVNSLCEDLAELTGHSNKTEARYVKKGKELQRKRRREERRYRSKIKVAERRIRKLEERLLNASGGTDGQCSKNLNDSDTSNGDTTNTAEDEEDDEVRLEKKLNSIGAKSEQDKAAHKSEVDSIRRQCEQLKLRLSVVRLVMEGDDNLREYTVILDNLNPSIQRQRRKAHTRRLSGGSAENQDFRNDAAVDREFIPPPPPSRVTRARARLLKATHLERIYEQRLAVSKAFTDAAINALEQELSEREDAGQKMEVRCLNELMAIDSEIKDVLKEGADKMLELESEAQRLGDAIAACGDDPLIDGIQAMLGGSCDSPASAIDLLKPTSEVMISTDNDSSSESSEISHGKISQQNRKADEPTNDTANDDNGVDNFPRSFVKASLEIPSLHGEGSSNFIDPELKLYSSGSIRTGETPTPGDEGAPITSREISPEEDVGPTKYRAAGVEPTRELEANHNNISDPSNSLPSENDHGSVNRSETIRLPAIKTHELESTVNRASHSECSVRHISGESKSNSFETNDECSKKGNAIGETITRPIYRKPETIDDDSRENLGDRLPKNNISSGETELDGETAVEPALREEVTCDEMSEVMKGHSLEKKSESSTLGDKDSEKANKDELTDRTIEPKFPLSLGQGFITSEKIDLEVASSDSAEVAIETEKIKNENHYSVPQCSSGIEKSAIHSDNHFLNSKKLQKPGEIISSSINRNEIDRDLLNHGKPDEPTDTDKDDVIGNTAKPMSRRPGVMELSRSESFDSSKRPPNQEGIDEDPPTHHVGINHIVCDLSFDDHEIESPASISKPVEHDAESSHCAVTEAALRSDPNMSSYINPQQKAVLEILGRELKCTLADYQTGFDLSSSGERIEQLDYMNNIVLKIAKVRGINMTPNNCGHESSFKSWSLAPKRAKKDKSDKKSTKKKRRKRKQRKDKKQLDGSNFLQNPEHHSEDKKEAIQAKNKPFSTHVASALVW